MALPVVLAVLVVLCAVLAAHLVALDPTSLPASDPWVLKEALAARLVVDRDILALSRPWAIPADLPPRPVAL